MIIIRMRSSCPYRNLLKCKTLCKGTSAITNICPNGVGAAIGASVVGYCSSVWGVETGYTVRNENPCNRCNSSVVGPLQKNHHPLSIFPSESNHFLNHTSHHNRTKELDLMTLFCLITIKQKKAKLINKLS